jgi:hypothetical protein
MQRPDLTEKHEDDPWNIGGKMIVNDFVIVMEGELSYRTGFVKEIIDPFNIVMQETRLESAQPPVIVERQQTGTEAQLVSANNAIL